VFGLAPTSSGLPSAQLSLYQAKLQQARREAAQAQAQVQSLEAQTESARQQAAQAQNEVRSLEGKGAPRSDTQTTLNSQGETTGRLLNTQA
jgi:multidrug resistance efflux pump